MSDCADCDAAENGKHHIFTAGCRVCQARAASRSQPFFQSLKRGRLTAEYVALLGKMGLQHEEVKAARAKDAGAKGG